MIESACVFLGASVPVYSALLLASGNTAAGGSYSFWTLAAGSLIPALSSALLMPLLHMFLLLALASSLCGGAFDKLLAKPLQLCQVGAGAGGDAVLRGALGADGAQCPGGRRLGEGREIPGLLGGCPLWAGPLGTPWPPSRTAWR